MTVIQVPAQRVAPQPGRRDWCDDAACREADPELFFPVAACGPGAAETERAKAVCAACPVRRQCLQYAVATHQAHGVWGGLSEAEREPLHALHERDRRQLYRGRRAHLDSGVSGTPGTGGRTRSV